MRRSLVAARLFFAVPAFTQEFRGSISGLVTDATSSPIAGANVNVSEANTGAKVETVTDTSGHYTAQALLPGDYVISVEFEGFKESVRKAVHLGAGKHPAIDVVRKLGEATQ